VVIAAGGGVAAEPESGRVGPLEIAPTVLGRFGLYDPGLPGRPLAAATPTGPLAPAPSAAPPPALKSDALMVYKLRKDGYRPPGRPGRAWRAQGLADLAAMMLDRDPAGAKRMAEAALLQDGAQVTALRTKLRAHIALQEPDPLPPLGDALLKAAPDRGWGALAHGAYHVMRGERTLATPWLRQAEADPDVTTLLTAATVWLAASRPAAAERVFKAIIAKDPLNVPAEIGLAIGALRRRDFMAAEQGLHRALKQDPGRPAIYLQLAQTYALSARKTEAARCAALAVRLGAHPALAAAAEAGRLRG
jgi:predicted Zn-dependent protease